MDALSAFLNLCGGVGSVASLPLEGRDRGWGFCAIREHRVLQNRSTPTPTLPSRGREWIELVAR